MEVDKLIEFIRENATGSELRRSQREIVDLAQAAELFCCETEDELKTLALENTALVEPE